MRFARPKVVKPNPPDPILADVIRMEREITEGAEKLKGAIR
jgi:hypothetical protein